MKKIIIPALLTLSIATFAFGNGSIDGSLNTGNNSTNSNNTDQSINGSTVTTHNNNGTNIPANTTSTVTSNQAAPVALSNLTTSGQDTCFGSTTTGISAAGFGISNGETVVDENCVMIKQVKLLASIGLKDAAVSLLIKKDQDIAWAIATAYPELAAKLDGSQNMQNTINMLINEIGEE